MASETVEGSITQFLAIKKCEEAQSTQKDGTEIKDNVWREVYTLPPQKSTIRSRKTVRFNVVAAGDNNVRGQISVLIIHQIFFAPAIGLNTSRDTVKAGEYQMIFPK